MILDIILRDKKKRLDKLGLDIEVLEEQCRSAAPPRDFYSALRYGGISIIGEIKKASPSKGVIREDFPFLHLAREYEGVVEGISVLTEEDHFMGSMDYLEKISAEVATPTLCKDFIFTREQVYLARSRGASSILLITRILEQDLLTELLSTARALGMEPLVETHTREEVGRAIEAGARIIGINNRDLSDFSVDIKRSIELSKDIPEDVVVVAESGIRTWEDVAALEEAGIHAVLVGETFMRSSDIPGAVRDLRGKITMVKICGIKSVDEIATLNKTKPHYAGFVFARSKRQVDMKTCTLLRSHLHPSIKTVGVFVDESYEEVIRVAEGCRLDVIQLHGREDTRLCKKLRDLTGCMIWKALPGETISNNIIKNYSEVTDSLLFDSLTPGGGHTFNWNHIKDSYGDVILAGGLNTGNVARGIRAVKPAVVDVSSGVEGISGKVYTKVFDFIEEVRRYG